MTAELSTEEICAVVATAFAEDVDKGHEAVRQFYAEVVDFRHDPPSPGDGPLGGSELAAAQRAEGAMFKAALPGFGQQGAGVRMDGDTILLEATLAGTLKDGSPLRVPITMRYTVADGAITELVATIDGADQLAKAFAG